MAASNERERWVQGSAVGHRHEGRPDEHAHDFRHRLHTVIFEADTPAGKAFDVVLLVAILASIAVVMLESVGSISLDYGALLLGLEWFFTGLFLLEYVLRLIAVRRARAYALSFFGIVDLFSILPTFVALFFPNAQSLVVIRALRILRVFRILKLARFASEARGLREALWVSREKITVFVTTVAILVTILGSSMYLIEDAQNGFDSIPQSVYWAVVTMTTVGYGDVTPITPLGKGVAVVIMLLGYSMIIVPTGILSAELATKARGPINTQACRTCGFADHPTGALFCHRCGAGLN